MRTVTTNLDYIRKLYAPQDALLEEIASALEARNIAIQIGPEEGKLLQLLIHMSGVRTVVEVGSLFGYSAIWMARALPAGGKLYACNMDPDHINMARGYFGRSDVKDRIEMVEGDAHKTLPTLNAKGPFDMLFIDAEKEGYNAYLDWAESNIRKGGLIVADNTLLFDAVAHDEPPPGTAPATWKHMRRFNQRLADERKYHALLLPTEEGLTVAIKLF